MKISFSFGIQCYPLKSGAFDIVWKIFNRKGVVINRNIFSINKKIN